MGPTLFLPMPNPLPHKASYSPTTSAFFSSSFSSSTTHLQRIPQKQSQNTTKSFPPTTTPLQFTSIVGHCPSTVGQGEAMASREMTKEYGQDFFLAAQATNGIGNEEKAALLNLAKFSRDGIEKLMRKNKLDALVNPFGDSVSFLAISGYPGISVPAGYIMEKPFGIIFGGLKGTEPKLIEIAYAFEEATKIRKPPSFKP